MSAFWFCFVVLFHFCFSKEEKGSPAVDGGHWWQVASGQSAWLGLAESLKRNQCYLTNFTNFYELVHFKYHTPKRKVKVDCINANRYCEKFVFFIKFPKDAFVVEWWTFSL